MTVPIPYFIGNETKIQKWNILILTIMYFGKVSINSQSRNFVLEKFKHFSLWIGINDSNENQWIS